MKIGGISRSFWNIPRKLKHPLGFTLLELLAVSAVIGILILLLVPVVAKGREMGRKTGCLSNLKELGLATMFYSKDYDNHLPYPNINYTSDWIMSLPLSERTSLTERLCWFNALDPYLSSNDPASAANQRRLEFIKQDPVYKTFSSLDKSNSRTYKWNEYLGKWEDGTDMFWRIIDPAIHLPNSMVMIIDGRSEKVAPAAITERRAFSTTPGSVYPRHNDGANVLFLDGHAEWKQRPLKKSASPNVPAAWDVNDDPGSWKPWSTAVPKL